MNNYKNHKPSRLERIERKCNLILSQLTTLSNVRVFRSEMMDDAIERMHINARRMRARAHRDAENIRKAFQSKRS